MVGGCPSAPDIIQQDRTYLVSFHVTVDQYDRRVQVQGRPQGVVGESRTAQQETVNALFFQRFQGSRLTLWTLIRVAHDYVVTRSAGFVLGSPGHVRKEGVSDIRYYQAQGAGTPGCQPTGDAAGTVSQLLDHVHDAAASGWADLAFIVDYP
jgi:hypothetical protein